MNKLITFALAVSITIPVFSQKVHTHSHSPGKAIQKKKSYTDLISHKYSKYLPLRQKSSDAIWFKNTAASKQQLDMIYSAELEKDEYRYDNMGNVIEDIYYEWYDNQWLRVVKSEYSYDNKGNNTMYTESEWAEDQWQNSMKNEAAYDSDGNNTLKLTYIWAGSEWVNIYNKEEYSYDDNGNQTEHISSFWVETQYMNSGKEVFSYDDQGNEIQNLSYLWDGSEWTNWMKEDFLFDSNGNLSRNTNYQWDGTQWVNYDQSEFTYNSKSELTLIVSSFWDGNDWIDTEKFELGYNPSGNILQSVFSSWEEDQWMAWQTIDYEYDSNENMTLIDVNIYDINIYKEISVYDEQGNRTENTIYQGDWETGLLANSWKAETSYDNNFAFEDLILPFIPEYYENDDDDDYSGYEEEGLDLKLLFNHKLLRMVSYEGVGDNWLLESDYTLVYSEQNITGLEKENSESGLSIYPNPASSQVSFTMGGAVDRFKVQIYDAQGKIRISQIVENNMPVSIKPLQNGVYFYRLQAPGVALNGKLVVQ